MLSGRYVCIATVYLLRRTSMMYEVYYVYMYFAHQSIASCVRLVDVKLEEATLEATKLYNK